MRKKKLKKLTSPVGTAIYPHLSKPDTKFNEDGEYRVNLRLSMDDAKPLLKELHTILKDHVEEVKSEKGKSKIKTQDLPYNEVETEGSPTGEVDVKFKLKAVAGSNDNKWEQRPALFNDKGERMNPEETNVGSGSAIKIGFEVFPYYTGSLGAGLSLRMKAVQVLDLVEFGGNEFDNFDFAVKESATEEAEAETDGEEDDDDLPF
mgnify:FL=1